VIFVFCQIAIFAEEESEETELLQWEPVQNATSYRVEVKDVAGNILLSEITPATKMVVKLGPGDYSHRVGVVGKFGKITGWSDWVEFTVVQSVIPDIEIKEILYGAKTQSEQKVTLIGKNFLERTKVSVRSGENILSVKNFNYLNGTEIGFTLDLQNAKDGVYELTLENPRKKIFRRPNFYVLKETVEKAKELATKIKDPKYVGNMNPEGIFVPPLWSVLWRSALFPGWGQNYREEKWKAVIFPVLLVITAGIYSKSYSEFSSAKRHYNDSVNLSLLMPQDPSLQLYSYYNYMQTNSVYSKAEGNLQLVRNASIALAVVYIYNILDVFIFHDYSKSAFREPEIKSGIHFFSESKTIRDPLSASKYGTTFDIGIRFSFSSFGER